MVRTWRRELGLAREKQSTTTSDLQGIQGERKKEKKVFISCTHNLTEIIDKTGKRWQRRADVLCHEPEMSAERRHVVFDGVKGTEKRERKEGSVLSH